MLAFKRYHFIVILTLILICSLSLNVLAVDMDDLNAEMDKQEQSQTPNSGNMLWLEFLKLVVVLGLIVGAAWSIIRLFSKQVANKMQGTWIHVVDEVALGQNRGIVLCEVGEKLYAIGVSDSNINLLFEINNPKLLEEINLNDNIEKPPSKDWHEFKSLIKDKLIPNRSSASNPGKKEFHFLMNEQIQRMEKLSDNLGNSEMNIKRSDRND